jgi:hypothetical protein
LVKNNLHELHDASVDIQLVGFFAGFEHVPQKKLQNTISCSSMRPNLIAFTSSIELSFALHVTHFDEDESTTEESNGGFTLKVQGKEGKTIKGNHLSRAFP